jgi:tellurite resistance protein TehA-like permease
MKTPFSPLSFLASLGAGGIAVIPFAFLNYTYPHGKGLINMTHISYEVLSIWQGILFRVLEGTMIFFSLLHIILSLFFAVQLFQWVKEKKYVALMKDPLMSSALLPPFISLVMTMNVVIGPVRYFIPSFSENLQLFMLPALLFWGGIWVFLMKLEIKLLRISFETSFDVQKIHFGWLLHPFALGMATVTGTGIAALSTDASIAHIAAFLSLVSGTMGIFLLATKMTILFKSHFVAEQMPDKQFFPSLLIVIPNITLYAISAFRFGHYLEHHHGAEMGAFYMIVTTLSFAFETWYIAFGVSLLLPYFKKHFFKEFSLSQWGLVCPVVAYAVLGSFVYNTFIQSAFLFVGVLFVGLIAIILFFLLLKKHISCQRKGKNSDLICL